MESGETDNNLRLRKTFKDKLHEHYQKKDEIFTPSFERATKCGVIFYWYLSISMGLLMCKVIVPYLFDDHEYTFIPKFVTCILMIQSMINWLQVWRYQPVCEYKPQQNREEVNPPEPSIDWKFCLICQHYSPPRSHHCKLCKACILKRDHHCFFTTSCIGFYNQRYFITFLFYSAAGLAYTGYYLLLYNNKRFPILSYEGLKYFPAVNMFYWLAGYMTIFDLYMMWQLFCCLVAGTGSIGFFIWELILVICGQTTNEKVKGIKKYAFVGSLNQRFVNVFGEYWFINFIFPIPFYPKGRGIYYRSKDDE